MARRPATWPPRSPSTSIKRLDTPDLLTASAPSEPAEDGDGEQHRGDRRHLGERPTTRPEQGAAGLNPLLGRFAAAIAEANDRIADLVAADYAWRGWGRPSPARSSTVSGWPGPHRRQPGLPAARRSPGAAHPRPQLGAVPRRRRQDLPGRGRLPPAPVPAAQGAERPAGQRPRPDHRGAPGRRPVRCSAATACAGWSTTPRSADLAAASRPGGRGHDLVDAALAAGGIDNITVHPGRGRCPAPTPADAAGAETADGSADADEDAVHGRTAGGRGRPSCWGPPPNGTSRRSPGALPWFPAVHATTTRTTTTRTSTAARSGPRRHRPPATPTTSPGTRPARRPSGRSSARCWSVWPSLLVAAAGLGAGLRLDPHPVLRRRRRRPGRHLPGPARRHPGAVSSPRSTRCRTCRWRACRPTTRPRSPPASRSRAWRRPGPPSSS